MLRWRFTDPVTSAFVDFEYNPNKMGSINHENTTTSGPSVRPGRASASRGRQIPHDWNFSGIYRSQAGHDNLLAWSQRPGSINLTDHYGRVFEIMIKAFIPTERAHATLTWRGTYEMNCLMIRRIS